MKDLFASLYEYFIYDPNYSLLFQVLYDDGGYVNLGFSFILISLTLWAIFYYVWKYPYGKFIHWFVWLLIVACIIFGFSWWITDDAINFSNNQNLIAAMSDPQSGYQNFADTLPLKYALYNSFFSILIGFIWSTIMRPFSKIQMHLPF